MTKLFETLELHHPLEAQDRDILTDDACAFVYELVNKFSARRDELLTARGQWQDRVNGGQLPDFRADTKAIRDGDWNVLTLPDILRDRRVEITGPTDRKMVINALNADVKVFMADFEDALSPHWRNIIEGQRNLRDAVNGMLSFNDPKSGKAYQLEDNPALLMARVRGLHLNEKHITQDGKPVPGCLVDFGLYCYHNAQTLSRRKRGPYFYVPKLEHAEEARWWADVFNFTEGRFNLTTGTIRATVLIETLPAVFEMDEILYELRNHAAGLNCGRWDYIFSYIKTLKAYSERVLPDRQLVGMAQPFLDAYSRLLIATCHKRGVLAMGGMSAFLPAKSPTEDLENKEKVRADKQREADNGHDGSWVAHPALASIVDEIYTNRFQKGASNQLEVLRKEDAPILAEHLLATPLGDLTAEGLITNIRVGVRYIEAWLSGLGAVAIDGLMEDAATAEISRASIWQWIKHGAELADGRVVTHALFDELFKEAVEKLQEEIGSQKWQSGRYDEAVTFFEQLCTQNEFSDFLTLKAYETI